MGSERRTGAAKSHAMQLGIGQNAYDFRLTAKEQRVSWPAAVVLLQARAFTKVQRA